MLLARARVLSRPRLSAPARSSRRALPHSPSHRPRSCVRRQIDRTLRTRARGRRTNRTRDTSPLHTTTTSAQIREPFASLNRMAPQTIVRLGKATPCATAGAVGRPRRAAEGLHRTHRSRPPRRRPSVRLYNHLSRCFPRRVRCPRRLHRTASCAMRSLPEQKSTSCRISCSTGQSPSSKA